jgi:hypothetical protein
MCDADKSCLGFTFIGGPTCSTCTGYLYPSVNAMQQYTGADWYQKPGTAIIPGTKANKCPPAPRPPPSPPLPCASIKARGTCVFQRCSAVSSECSGCTWKDGACTNPPPPSASKLPPPPLKCSVWNELAKWKMIGCDANGTNCVLQITVANGSKAVQSTNVLPFVPPKAMRLPVAAVTATAGASVVADGETEEAEITLATSATAMFVTLTTKEQGRFSDIIIHQKLCHTIQVKKTHSIQSHPQAHNVRHQGRAVNVSQWLAINASAAAASMLPISSSNAGSMPRAATSDPNLLRCFMLSSVGPWQVLMSDPALQWLVPSCGGTANRRRRSSASSTPTDALVALPALPGGGAQLHRPVTLLATASHV